MLLARAPNVLITESVLVAVASNALGGIRVIHVLLARDTTIEITEAVLVGAAGNWLSGAQITQVLLASDLTIEICESILVSAASNIETGDKVLGLFLARDAHVQLTEAIILAAQGSHRIMEWLTASHVNLNTAITETVLEVVAAKSRSAKAILGLLLARNPNIDCTERVLVAAAGNRHDGEVMEFLLAKAANIEIPESILVAAAGNFRYGVKFIKLFLAKTANLTITLDIARAAAGIPVTPAYRREINKPIISWLLETDTNIEGLEAILSDDTDLREVVTETLLRARQEFIAFNPPAQNSIMRSITPSA